MANEMQFLDGMQAHSIVDPPVHTPRDRGLRLAAGVGVGVAVVLAVISAGGILIPDTYARETPSWAIQGLAQDWFDLVVAAPILCAAAILAGRSRRAQLVLAGSLLFASYTLAIYAFAVHLNGLFLLYCAGLGGSLYALIALARSLDLDRADGWFGPRVPRRMVGGFLIVIGTSFALLWLFQLVPAAVTGRVPQEIVATGLLTNPVHVLDLSFILPLHLLAGVLLWRRQPVGYALAPIVLWFGTLMAASIGLLAWMMQRHELTGDGPALVIAMAALSASCFGLFVWMMRCRRS